VEFVGHREKRSPQPGIDIHAPTLSIKVNSALDIIDAPMLAGPMTQRVAPVTDGVISSPDTQTATWFLDSLSHLRLGSEQTGGAFSLRDNLARRGNASPVHAHDRDDETFFVLDGELRVFVGDQDHTAGPGTVALLPRRLRHAYVVTSATARFLTLHTPGGFERFAAEIGRPAEALTLPPEPAAPPDAAAMARTAARHGITILAPPPVP
jgi:quercetin dioxygenase-like cupin family protein